MQETEEMTRPALDWRLGGTDDSYGTMVWHGRVQNLMAHFRIIADHLPEDANWLRNQVRYAIEQAQGYLDDYAPTNENDKRCGYCDGTGDVHRADGEWLGSCSCSEDAAP